MNVLEWTGIAVWFVVFVGALGYTFGLIKVEARVSIEKKD